MLDTCGRKTFVPAGYPRGLIGSLELTLDDPEKSSKIDRAISVQGDIVPCKDWPLQVEGAMRRIEPDKWREATSFTLIKEEGSDELRRNVILKRMKREPNPWVFFLNRVKAFDGKMRNTFLNLIHSTQKTASIIYIVSFVDTEPLWLVVCDEGCNIVSQNIDAIKTVIPFAGIKKVTRTGAALTLVADLEKGKGKTRSVDLRFKKETLASLVHNLILSSL
jgi:hypothetical protein